MKVTESKPENGVIKLECEATAIEVNKALEEAAIAFAMSMGLRPVPNKTVEEAIKEQLGVSDVDKIIEPSAIEVLVPRALDRRNLMPAFPPKANPTSPFERGKKFTFTLNVTVKPTYELTSYEPVEVTVEPYTFDESVIDQQLASMAERSSTYVAIDPKPLEDGDACEVALKVFDDGEELKGMTTEGRTYVLGSQMMPKGFDDELIGMEPGQTKEFSFDAPMFDEAGNESVKKMDCVVTVKEIQKEVPAVIDDEWVKVYVPPFKSVDDLRADMRRMLEIQQRQAYDNYVQGMVIAALSKRFQGRIADEIYEATRDQLMMNMRMELQQSGMTWEQFMAQNGGEQQFGMMMMLQTREVLVQGFCLDSVFAHEKLTLTDEDLDAACRNMNPQGDAKMMREQLEATGRSFALRETAERLKAAKYVTEHAVVTVRDASATPAEKAADEAAVEEAKKDAEAE